MAYKTDINADVNVIIRNAENGDADAQHDMGQRYFGGTGVEQNIEKAAYWFEKAASQNHPSARHMLGYFYLSGIGVNKDTDKGFKLTLAAAEGNDPDGKYNLGLCYYNGEGTDIDYEKAVCWFKQACESEMSNRSAAFYSLGYCYYMGHGVEKDYDKAAELIKTSADLGDTDAQYFLKKNYTLKDGKYIKKKFLGLF